MKICATVAEYNPFHLGHLKHIEYMKTELGAERVIVLMSGNFTQRGEPAVLNKFIRAKQAIIAGADAVIELPTVFATANAETFATGAVNLLDDLGVADGLCFGVESGKKEKFFALAKALLDETKEFKRILKNHLEDGVSLAKAKFLTVKELKGEEMSEELISLPNNILGLEYTKALIKRNSSIEPYPMLREGDHNSIILKKGITSATSIRQKIREGKLKKLKKSLPPYVYDDLKPYPFAFDKITTAALITASKEKLAETPDCSEGLENRIKALVKDNKHIDALVDKISTKRYTAARIRRIFIANLLGITKEFTEDCLSSRLYAKVLAVNADCKDIISMLTEKSRVPIITRKSDISDLKKTALKSFELDVLANDVYNLATNENTNENQMIIV
ncbi:MAG: nucleotidyltransferase family protein [Clostridia bacterium]|nr:nucleotidyltransferase family protein [Clostridia bacterium]